MSSAFLPNSGKCSIRGQVICEYVSLTWHISWILLHSPPSDTVVPRKKVSRVNQEHFGLTEPIKHLSTTGRNNRQECGTTVFHTLFEIFKLQHFDTKETERERENLVNKQDSASIKLHVDLWTIMIHILFPIHYFPFLSTEKKIWIGTKCFVTFGWFAYQSVYNTTSYINDELSVFPSFSCQSTNL